MYSLYLFNNFRERFPFVIHITTCILDGILRFLIREIRCIPTQHKADLSRESPVRKINRALSEMMTPQGY